MAYEDEDVNPGTAEVDEEVGEGKDSTDEATALLPKSFFPSDKPLEVGNTCTIEISRALDDQVEVTYSREAKAEPEEVVEEEVDTMV